MKSVFPALLLAVVAGCARDSGGIPVIKWGRDACARCGMILGEERFASGYVAADGSTVAYDDIGEFLAASAENPSLAAKVYVQDASGRGWMPASQAVFVKISGLATPMGSGWAAFASQSEADEFARHLKMRVEGAAVTLAARGS
ncbi:MAG: nitrous oxide reductase accessory protein NosL [Elusimicrobia bacterium]|nr:nitrous oxide reductase accessory protein NosL [Elusimicrobiota bacterium]